MSAANFQTSAKLFFVTTQNNNKHPVDIEQLRYALDDVAAFVYIKNPDSRYLYANQLTLDLFRCAEEDLSEKTDHDFIPAETVNRLWEVVQQVWECYCFLVEQRTADEVLADADRLMYESKRSLKAALDE